MNENNLYYKRGMYILDKLLKNFNNDSTFYQKRREYMESEVKRLLSYIELVNKDINSLYITSIVALLGLNKENIEKINKHSDYNFNNYDKSNLEIMKMFKKVYSTFIDNRNIQTKFDDWLCLENCDHPSICYMMNIRNGILHSEYEPVDDLGYVLSVKNSNYTHFKGKILIPGIINFCKFYFGNNSWSGLSENFNFYTLLGDNKINTEEELDHVLKTVEVHKVNYERKSSKLNQKIPEMKFYDEYEKIKKRKKDNISVEEVLDEVFTKNYGYDYTIEDQNFTIENIDIIKKMIEKYYGEEFYNLKMEEQLLQIINITRYFVDSRSTISEWICDYIETFEAIRTLATAYHSNLKLNYRKIIVESDFEENRRSVFASRTSLLILKLYHVLYRLQYKNYEEVDYSMINFDITSNDYSYTRIEKNGSTSYDFNIDKAKMRLDYPNETEKEIENRIICEVIRDALSHGNVEMNFKIENDELVEYIVLEDIYKGKNRKLEITLDKLEKFLISDAFKVENCIVKENTQKVKIIQ